MGLISYIYKKIIVKRYDDNGIIHYFSYKDFPLLEATPIEFFTPQNLKIKGYFYNYNNYKEDRLIIFCHGIGGGHRSYMKEIELLCKEGYQVLAYDNIGCFESEGKDIRGMEETLNDLYTVLTSLKENHYLDNKSLSLIGHSWGGHAVSNILSYYQDIDSIVCISGYVSYKLLASTFFNKNNFLCKCFYQLEKKANPKFADSSSINALKNTKTKALIIHSKDDTMVKIDIGAYYLQNNIDNPNVTYFICEGKDHNPNYTIDAITYMKESFKTYHSLVKNKKLKTLQDKKKYMDNLDWDRMTKQDMEIWEVILEHIK